MIPAAQELALIFCKTSLKTLMKGKERKGKERKGKERKGKERKIVWNSTLKLYIYIYYSQTVRYIYIYICYNFWPFLNFSLECMGDRRIKNVMAE